MKPLSYLIFLTSLTYCSPLLAPPSQSKPAANILPFNRNSPSLDGSHWDIRVNGGSQPPTITPNTDYKESSLSPLDNFKPPSINIPKPLTNSPGIMQIPGSNLIQALFTGFLNNGVPKNGIY